MKILEFEHNHFGVEDLKEILPQMGHSLKVVTTDLIFERISDEFDALFEKEISSDNYDLVFTFNYSVVVSQNCNRHGIKYVSWIYDLDKNTTLSGYGLYNVEQQEGFSSY